MFDARGFNRNDAFDGDGILVRVLNRKPRKAVVRMTAEIRDEAKRLLRLARSQKQIAHQLGIAGMTVSRIKCGHYDVIGAKPIGRPRTRSPAL
jgi:hypothetical protein